MTAAPEYEARVYRDPECWFGWYISSDYNRSTNILDADYALTRLGAKHKARKRLKQLRRASKDWDNKEFRVSL